ncbi:MAG: hypothetical protein JSW71_14045 [Gemmatimonadota bacterium]|nr:MAG: hypothetical protein JSW71_14045 [Gemmatimonadota bacterium]
MARVFTISVIVLLGSGLMSNGAAQEPEQIGDFYYVASVDPFDDEDRSAVATVELDADPDLVDTAYLAWQCMSDGLNVVYAFNRYFGGDSDDRVRVRYRIDSQPPSDFESWSLMQDNDAAWIPMEWVSGSTQRAQTGTKVVFRVTDPLDGETLTHEFSLIGLSEALTRLSCAVDH